MSRERAAVGILMVLLAMAVFVLKDHASPYMEYFRGGFFVDHEIRTLKTESLTLPPKDAKMIECDVLVVGGGTGGTAAAIQAARNGAQTCLTEESSWLGGMMTSAGVSSLDGHNWNYTGVMREFVTNVWHRYESPEKQTKDCLAPFCYEPSIGNAVLFDMVSKEPNLAVFLNMKLENVVRTGNRINGVVSKDKAGNSYFFKAHVTIEATEFGDVLYLGDVPYDLGPEDEEGCLQPITMVAILKDYGKSAAMVKRPANYDRGNYECFISSDPKCSGKSKFTSWDDFVKYGQLPDGKIMVNVPLDSYGNGFRTDIVELDSKSRAEILQGAREYTLGFIYFIQQELGKSNYGLVNEFDTSDRLAIMPYMRESRRLKGVVRLTKDDVTTTSDSNETRFWPDSIAVGDYPLDIHSCKAGENDQWVVSPPFQVPYMSLVPEHVDGLIAAEKNISVTHVANGRTRLQPIVMSIGQAAGAAAALAAKHGIEPREVNIDQLQRALLRANSRINFYHDVPPNHWAFVPVSILKQKNIMKGYGNDYFGVTNHLTLSELATILARTFEDSDAQYRQLSTQRSVTRGEAANWIVGRLNLAAPVESEAVNFADLHKDHPSYQSITALAYYGAIRGDDKFVRPDEYISRAETAMLFYRLKELQDSSILP